MTALHIAVLNIESGKDSKIIKLLISNGANVNARDK